MASGETSFNSYTFTCEWTVNELEARLYNPKDVESPVFSSPKGAQPATQWKLVILSSQKILDRKLPIDHQYLSIELRRQHAFNSTSRVTASQVTKVNDSSRETDEDVWVKASLKPPTVITKKKSKLFDRTVPKCTSI